jgi:CSLREA domain-containing protein
MLALITLASQPAGAANFTVTKFADTNDGACNTDCSLREAIIDANSNGQVDTITLITGTYTLAIGGTGEDAATTGDLDITTPVTITGAGPNQTIIDGGALDGVFHTLSDTVVISGLTISNGSSGGGIRNGANLTLINTIIISNDANLIGGGIFNHGLMVISNSLVISNTADSNGGGIYNNGTLTMSASTVSGNSTPFGLSGGGIDNNGTLTMTNSTVSDNLANFFGGGVANGAGALTIVNSTVSGNTNKGDEGGGIYMFQGTVTVSNSTISGNRILFPGGIGGGISNTQGTLKIINSTISSNTIFLTGTGGGLYSGSGGTIILSNTIVANHVLGGDCTTVNFTDGGYNLIEDGSCLSAPTSISGDPMLSPLQDNGGDTYTHALISGTLAVDAGSCPGVTTDQRGRPRPVDGDGDNIATCDLGAFELQVEKNIYLPLVLKRE